MPEAVGGADTAARLEAWRRRIDEVLETALADHPAAERRLGEAMRHAVLLGGKRMRPLLVYAAGTAFGADESALDAPAAAIELIHAYSLVHDDLPAMDDDALRRGQPTVHVAFDEATAILAGDALQSLAFATLADAACGDSARVAMLRELASAAGAHGMCGGQALDLAATGRSASSDIDALERLHALKTGALIRAAVRMGAIAADATDDDRVRLDAYADALGLAFQIRDDLLDVEGESATLGKTAGKDAAQDKATFPALIGIDASRARLAGLGAAMDASLAPFGARAAELATLGSLAIHRSH
ncbi:farnesyl diphosphate synthase [Luteimonas terricola]|uniref:Farnesyl-diphosphate synthase n=1 Tax=Luteimonas terricola TaxID=645597 RepID=A0ABQ2EFM6_9GAMM|nr:farnesyl diphosphate synthase [Luteimonas terricola]GGK07189.1 farnesyl-diphosphate synthase [Luteimonas terricola]